MLERHADAVDAAAPAAASAAAVADMGDGGAAARQPRGGSSVLQRLLAPLRLGQKEVLPALASLSSALAVSNLKQTLLHQLGAKLIKREVALHAALHAAKGAGGRVAVQVRRGAWGAWAVGLCMQLAASAAGSVDSCGSWRQPQITSAPHSHSPPPSTPLTGGQGRIHRRGITLCRSPLAAGGGGAAAVGLHGPGPAACLHRHRLGAGGEGEAAGWKHCGRGVLGGAAPAGMCLAERPHSPLPPPPFQVVFALAQIRLLRTGGFSNPDTSAAR